MLPIFKEVVEELFQEALLKVVFATETLALGINMPARTVVLERLVKWNGQTHADITPGEYTQLTGRAGRRGIDVEGHAVVVWGPSVQPNHVAGSGFHPHLPAALLVPADLQHGRQSGPPGRAADRPRTVWRRPSPSTRATSRSSGWPRRSSATSRSSTATESRWSAIWVTSASTQRFVPSCPRWRRTPRGSPRG
ncbi:MAG: helicase-related protein [Candidatus Nanopelagicales bacterium]